MNIYVTQLDRKNVVGGGWTFNQNLKKALKDKVYFVDKLEDADIFLISGVTMTERGQIDYAKAHNIPIIFRVDNIPKPSRNKRTDISARLKQYSQVAEVVVYQSQWSKNLLEDICGDGMVIYNGVDTDLFNKDGEKNPPINDKKKFLCVQHSSNPNKRFDEVKHIFTKKWRELEGNCELWLVGRFEGQEFNYDFIRGEKVRDLGVIEDKEEMAKVYRSADALIYPSFADSCPNTVLEARASGLEIIGVNHEGGTKELLLASLDISIQRMALEYLNLFKLITGGIG